MKEKFCVSLRKRFNVYVLRTGAWSILNEEDMRF